MGRFLLLTSLLFLGGCSVGSREGKNIDCGEYGSGIVTYDEGVVIVYSGSYLVSVSPTEEMRPDCANCVYKQGRQAIYKYMCDQMPETDEELIQDFLCDARGDCLSK